jgi:predicted xylose isomerase-like sugar epimerase
MKGLENLNYDGPVLVEPFNASLKALNFEDAVKAAKAAMDNVWPK